MKRNVYRFQKSGVLCFKVKVEHTVTVDDLTFTLAKDTANLLSETSDESEVNEHLLSMSKASVLKSHLAYLENDGTSFNQNTSICYDTDLTDFYVSLCKSRVEQLFPELV